jgi:hypothetical protein
MFLRGNIVPRILGMPLDIFCFPGMIERLNDRARTKHESLNGESGSRLHRPLPFGRGPRWDPRKSLNKSVVHTVVG